jgi:hypothetical protein
MSCSIPLKGTRPKHASPLHAVLANFIDGAVFVCLL